MKVGIGNHPSKKADGWVTAFLEPTQPLGINNSVHMGGHTIIGGKGQNLPPGMQEAIMGMVEQIGDRGRGGKINPDERSICFVEPKIDFIERGWKYGDVIDVSFEKKKNAEDVQVETERTEVKP